MATQQPAKRARNNISNRPQQEQQQPQASASSHMLDVADWQSLARTYKTNDETRELVIKKCRDMQKLSKNAIFALHRGDAGGAAGQIASAEAIAKELMPLISSNPSLRQGSFGNACEEYAEALIFQVYLREARVLPWKEVEWLTCEEYLGGLMDFTGELGRLAVARATERDDAAVSTYLALLDDLAARLTMLDPMQPGLRKKQGPLQATCSKVQRLAYELSLSQRSPLLGARLQAADPVAAPAGGDAGGDAAD